jgi:hypothetical protein
VLFVGLLLGAVLVGVGAQWLGARGWGWSRLESLGWRTSPVIVTTASLALIAIHRPAVHQPLGPYAERIVSRAQTTRLNWIDAEREERGYYETVSRSTRIGPSPLWALHERGDLDLGLDETPAVVETNDLRSFVLLPGAEIVYRGAELQTNRWGLRDREYDKVKPAGVYRVALLGSSYTMGLGVEGEETFENVTEDLLNRELAGRGYERYEILNFAVSGYGDLQTMYVAERVVPEFQPDVVIHVLHPGESRRIVNRLRLVLDSGAEIEDEHAYLTRVLRASGGRAGLPPEEFAHRLGPHRDALVRWALQREVAASRSHGALPVFVLLPLTTRDFEPSEERRIFELVRDAGGLPMILSDAYRGASLERIILTQADHHPNPLGHRLIAEGLYTLLLENADTLRLWTGDGT